jgi:hypothetical protein
MVAPPGQVGKVEWKHMCTEKRKKEEGGTLFQGLFKLPIICRQGKIGVAGGEGWARMIDSYSVHALMLALRYFNQMHGV